jgi:hypothetical protein
MYISHIEIYINLAHLPNEPDPNNANRVKSPIENIQFNDDDVYLNTDDDDDV